MNDGSDFGLIFVRNMFRAGKYFLTDHAYDKMGELRITKEEVEHCVLNGEIIEKQSGYEGESPRILIYNGHQRSFYVVVTVELPDCIVVSVIDTDFTIWEKSGMIIRRK